MTPEDQICSILQEIELRKSIGGWQLRDLTQNGMNQSRKLEKNGEWLYLFFLRMNLSQRFSFPAFWGQLYYFKQRLFLKPPVMNNQIKRFSEISPLFSRFLHGIIGFKH